MASVLYRLEPNVNNGSALNIDTNLTGEFEVISQQYTVASQGMSPYHEGALNMVRQSKLISTAIINNLSLGVGWGGAGGGGVKLFSKAGGIRNYVELVYGCKTTYTSITSIAVTS